MKKKRKKIFSLHKNRLFFGVFVVMVSIFALSIVQQKYGKDLTGAVASPVAVQQLTEIYDVQKYQHSKTTSGEQCVRIIDNTPYVHPDCLDKENIK